MKVKDIAKKYGLYESDFSMFARNEKTIAYKSGFIDDTIEDADVEHAVELYKKYSSDKKKYVEEEQAAEQRKKTIQSELRRDNVSMILSTCSTVDGYFAEEQLGLVFGECIFKASFNDSVDAFMNNLGASLSLTSKELTGTTDIIKKARDYAKAKMIIDAAELGANAITGIDCETSTGGGSGVSNGNIMHITICGTAVKLRKINSKAE